MHLAILVALLTGCGAAGFSCPPLVSYDPERQEMLASELTALADRGGYPAIERALVEYGQLRAMVRACRPMSLF